MRSIVLRLTLVLLGVRCSEAAGENAWKALKAELASGRLGTQAQVAAAWDKTICTKGAAANQILYVRTTNTKNNAATCTDYGGSGAATKSALAVSTLLVTLVGANVNKNNVVTMCYIGHDTLIAAEGDAAGECGVQVVAGMTAAITTAAFGNANGFTKAKFLALAPASAKGDPHVINMQGEKFDVLKSGTRVMVQYPRESSSDPSLVVTAQVVRADAKWCENTFIENVQAQGSMLGSSVSFTMGKLRAPGPFKVTVGEKSMSLSDVIKKKVALPTPGSYISGEAKQMTLTLVDVSVRIQLVKHSHFQFFNLDVSGLSNLPGEVGGLLGMDDHSGEAHEDCKFKTQKTKLDDVDDSSDLASLITAA